MKNFFEKANELKELTSRLEETVEHIENLISLCHIEGKGTEETKQAAIESAKDEIPQLMIQTIIQADSIMDKLAELQHTARKTEFDQTYELV
jgi:hypothetical protein